MEVDMYSASPSPGFGYASAGLSPKGEKRNLDSCFRRNDTAGRPLPQRGEAFVPLSPPWERVRVRGQEGVDRYLVCPLVCHSHESGNPVASFLDCCFRRNDTRPLTRLRLRLSRPLPQRGETESGFLLSQE